MAQSRKPIYKVLVVPSAPIITSFTTPKLSSITVKWSQSTTVAVGGYQVQVLVGATWSTIKTIFTSSNKSYTYNGSGTGIRVRSYNSTGYSSWSNTLLKINGVWAISTTDVPASTVGISLSAITSTNVPTAGSVSLQATVTGTTNQGVTWTCTGGSITPSGTTAVFTAPSTVGSYTVIATSAADTSKSATIVITVIAVQNITISVSTAVSSILTGGTSTVTATVSGTTNTLVNWSTTGGTITGSGTSVTYTAPSTAGTYKVKATSAADTSKSAEISMIVSAIPVVAVSITSLPAMYVNGTTTVTATVTGNANTAVTWSATGGTITGTGNTVTYTAPATAGSYIVTATSVADTSKHASSTAIVSVVPVVNSVSLNTTTVSLNTGATTSVTATVSVTGGAATTVTWSATGGTITGTGNTVTYTAPATAGTYTVTATSTANTSKSATLTATVSVPSGAVTISMTPSVPTAVGGNGTIQFTPTVSGSGNTSVTWAVDGITGGNSTVGTINSSGLFTAPAPSSISSGTIRTITATAAADTTKVATVRILVVKNNTITTVSPSGGNDTSAINSALATASTNQGICRLSAGNYTVDPLTSIRLKSNAVLLATGATINSTTQSTFSNYQVVDITENNSYLVGGVFNGDRIARNLPTYISDSGTDMEVGCGAYLHNNCSGAILLGSSFNNNCCDGIYLAGTANNWLISDVTADNNRRQGSSPVNAHDGRYQYCRFTNTNGNDPACGIDFEPNSGNHVYNVVVDNCFISGNAGGGVAGGAAVRNGIIVTVGGTTYGNNSALCDNITIQNCTITGNGGSNYRLGGIGWSESRYISIVNNKIYDNLDAGVRASYMFLNGVISNNTITGNHGNGLEIGDGFGVAGECANTVINNNTVRTNTQSPQIYIYPGCGATSSGNITT